MWIMASSEARQYLISGEVPLNDWSLALQVLGRLGIDAAAVDTSATSEEESQRSTIDILKPGTIPYTLDEIVARDQYLGNEHLGEFWPEHRKNLQEQGGRTPNKHEALC